jgi:ribosomal-protein-alanine N-acetyltransferase
MDTVGFYSDLPTIAIDRVVLRKMSLDDVPDVYSYASDPEVCKYVEWYHGSKDVSKSFVQWNLNCYLSGKPGAWAIEHSTDHRMIGTFAYSKWEPRHSSAAVGYVLNRSYWNRGLMTAILREMVRFGFERMGLNRIEATCDTLNVGSWRVMEQAGMVLEGVKRQDVFIKGHFRDSRLYSILKSEWESLRQNAPPKIIK